MIAAAELAGVGQPVLRPDGLAKVSGSCEYAPDLREQGMLWGATLRSPHPFARLLRVDLNQAKALEGVEAVLGAWDVPDNRYGVIERDSPVLADDYVRYEGEPIAIVAAVDRETARRALALIDVEYEVLTPETNPVHALADDKVYRKVKLVHGDPHATADVIAEGEYSTPRQDHSFLGVDSGIARPDGRGGVEIIGATQWVHSDRAQVAACLALPVEKVLVRNSGVAGSFGGRFVLSWQVHGALLAMHTRKPVKFVYTRRETFLARYHRQPSRIWVRHHAKHDGTIVKLEAKLLYQCGPYINTSGCAIGNGASLIQGAYHVPNAVIEGWAVATNDGMTGSLRGFGVVEPIYACESNMDRLAEVLGMDGGELRRRNAMKQGERWANNQVQDRIAPVAELISAVESMPLPDSPGMLPGGVCTPSRSQDISRGVSVSAAAKNVCLSEGAPVGSTALITLRDGVATIECAAAEVGQGFVTIAQQITQSTLGVSDVRLGVIADTLMAEAATTDGQQQTMTSGAAVAVAAAALKKRFLAFCSREYKTSDPLDIRDDCVVDSHGTVLATVADAGMGLEFRAFERFDQRRTRAVDDVNSPDPQHVTMNFSANRCVVDVDRELGLVQVVQMDVVQDPGCVVNPLQARGQIEGGSMMGLGLAVMEDFRSAGGRMVDASWETYTVPTAADAPEFNIEFISHAEPGIPFGMRGIAELPHVQAPPAVMGAIRNATGLDLPAMPARPDFASGADTYEPLGIAAAGRPVVKGPWKTREVDADYGPWRADVPVTE